MDKMITYIFIVGFLGSVVSVLIMLVKALKGQEVFSVLLIVSLGIFLSTMSLSIGIKMASVKILEVKKEVPIDYETAIKKFNKGDFDVCIEYLDKVTKKSEDDECVYKANIIKLSILMSQEKSIRYIAELFSGAAEKGKILYSYDDLDKFGKVYNEVYKQSGTKEQQVSDHIQIILNNIDDKKMKYKFPLKYKYTSKSIKDLGYFKVSAYPIPDQKEIDECREQAYNYNIMKFTQECIIKEKIYYPKFFYTAANCLDNKKHREVYIKCLNKVIEISDKNDEYRKKAEEDLKKL